MVDFELSLSRPFESNQSMSPPEEVNMPLGPLIMMDVCDTFPISALLTLGTVSKIPFTTLVVVVIYLLHIRFDTYSIRAMRSYSIKIEYFIYR